MSSAYAPDPFSLHSSYLSQNPANAKGTTWIVANSYAWAIWRSVVTGLQDQWNSACAWGQLFQQAFKAPYLNIVLPAFPGSKDRLVNLLRSLLENLERLPKPDALTELGLPSFMLDAPYCLPPVWASLYSVIRSAQNRMLFQHGVHDEAFEPAQHRAGIWAAETCEGLAPFEQHGPYSGLSRQLLKFYTELQKTAIALSQTSWRLSAPVIASWPLEAVLQYVITGYGREHDGIADMFERIKLEALAGHSAHHAFELGQGQDRLRRFSGPIGLRSARRYGIKTTGL
ncbi:hypothetical protein JCM10908_001901 [Rhodotorula pacifica]|uniref:uncharacterized protein n=1 Tax=Rhodotorula pacifica TaxID=1495444 RepID=UPI00316D107F